jgi:hypothetical protein
MRKKLFTYLLVLIFMLACQGISSQDKIVPTPVKDYIDLRNIWFTGTAEDLGLVVEHQSTIPFAVVMDIEMGDFTVSIASSIIGDGSMFTTTGSMVIGGIENESVRNASINFVKVAADFVEKMELTTEFPLPSAGNAKFYLLTPSGIYTTDEADPDMLARGNHELSPLFLAGNDVMTELLKVVKENKFVED